jgi:hypothetical protein
VSELASSRSDRAARVTSLTSAGEEGL